MLRIETALLAVAILIAWVYPSLGSCWFEKMERRFSALAQRRTLAVILVGATALALRLAVLPVEPIPEPIVHDEFGYLLAADTFAHGRLTNPTPPMWEHFETFSILMKPTYQCFAQPGQGMMLALGRVVFGHPFWGVWLSCGLMCAAITWMLQAWLGPEWALLGGVLAILRYGVFGYWADSYWGGAVAAIGGALVLGALPRIKQSQRVRDAVIMGVGLAILANTRPFEGFVFSLPVAVVLIAWLLGKKSPCLRVTLPRVVVPLTLMLALTAAGLGYYLWRVTGSPLRMPYQIERQTYAVAPYMIWQKVRPEPVYHHIVMKKMYTEEELFGYNYSRTFAGVVFKAFIAWNFFLGPALVLPLLLLVFSIPAGFQLKNVSGNTLVLVAVLLVSIASALVESFYSPHYSAPATALFIAFVVLALKQLRSWNASGVFLVRAVASICVLSFALRSAALPLRIPIGRLHVFAWHQEGPPRFGREALLARLNRLPGKQLVIVRYKPESMPFSELVYNESDIENAKVIWAREMNPLADHELMDYYKDRHVWLVDTNYQPPALTKYPSNGQSDVAHFR